MNLGPSPIEKDSLLTKAIRAEMRRQRHMRRLRCRFGFHDECDSWVPLLQPSTGDAGINDVFVRRCYQCGCIVDVKNARPHAAVIDASRNEYATRHHQVRP